MNLTEDSLIDEFDRRGIPLNKRVLTDWRAKGFLPALEVKGLGQGKGKTHFWSDPKVIDRALLVDEALQSDFRGSKMLLVLWLFGYEMPTALIREHLLNGLKKFAKMARGERQERGAIEEHIDDLTAKYYKVASKYPQLELPKDMRPAAMEMVLNVFVNPTYNLNDGPFEDGVLASLEAESKTPTKRSAFRNVSHSDRVKNTEAMWRFVHEHFSLNDMQAALEAATEDRFHQVQADIKLMFDFFGQVSAGKPEIEKLRELRVQAGYSVGMLLSIVDLTLRHQELGYLIDDGLSRLANLDVKKLNKS